MHDLDEQFELSAFEHYLHCARFDGKLSDKRFVGSAGGAPCGDLICISVDRASDGSLSAGFRASGCGAAQAAAACVKDLIDGSDVLEAAKLSPESISNALGGLTPQRFHAASLACDALHQALSAACEAGALALFANPGRMLVAMSGGVDSAVAAKLVLEGGADVVAVTLKLWQDAENDGEKSCCSSQAVLGARALAHSMGLPHFTLDLQKQFRREVVDDFIAAYNAGATPNPCIRCNGIVRFDGMLSLADQLGAAGLCTGHYARIGWDAQGPIVERALDEQKDQSYMLARLDPAKLRRISFPLGELTKQRVRQIARDGALPVADKRESQDLCFMAGVNRGDFLKKHAPKPQPSNEPRGEIVDTEGRVLGYHGGHQLFTVGQRKGLGIASEQPLYVLSKDADRNAVVVGPAQELNTHQLVLEDAQLFRSAQAVDQVKVRYRSQPVGASLSAAPPGRYGRLEIGLSESLRGIAPGQVACLMRGDAVIGYGTIATS